LVRLRPVDPPAAGLALVAAVALHQTASCFTPNRPDGEPPLRLKWPNDLMSPAGEKLAGILLERAGDAVVIGFGVNLAQHPQLERPVSSIAALFGSAPKPSLFGERLAQIFAGWLGRWREQGVDPVRRAWLRAAHPLGTRLITPEGEGAYDGLDPDGALRLKTGDGTIRLVHAGDVFMRA
jgi:BirA family transcriptional regulator, biotin operon repressor / biotin---[acetyl-CoA-carboxylase] ligase